MLGQRLKWLVGDVEDVGDRNVEGTVSHHVEAALSELPESVHYEQSDDRSDNLTNVCPDLPHLQGSIFEKECAFLVPYLAFEKLIFIYPIRLAVQTRPLAQILLLTLTIC